MMGDDGVGVEGGEEEEGRGGNREKVEEKAEPFLSPPIETPTAQKYTFNLDTTLQAGHSGI